MWPAAMRTRITRTITQQCKFPTRPLAATPTLTTRSLSHAAISTSANNARIATTTTHLYRLPIRSLTSSRSPFATHSIVVPSMGDSITEGTLVEVNAQTGVDVNVDDIVAKLDTDKVSVDIRSTVAGSVKAWHAKLGDTVKVGSKLLDVEIGAAGTASSKSTPPPSSSSPLKQPSAVQSQADYPNLDIGEEKQSPFAVQGTQTPLNPNPADPADNPHRVPMIQFRYGKRTVVPYTQQGHQHQGNQPLEVPAADWMASNEAAAAAWDSLPERYKRKPLKARDYLIIELGGAEPYESRAEIAAKKKAAAAAGKK